MGNLIITDLSRIFTKENGISTHALNNINLEVHNQEFVCIIGPSGCGKTTILRIIAGLDVPTSGKVSLDNVPITGPGPKRGMVFQEYSLFPWRTVIDNVTFGLEICGTKRKEARIIANKYLELVGLSKFANSYPFELSGGMKQRVAIARALINEPVVLLMDEPFGAVDAQTRNKLQLELLNIWERDKKTVLFITHSVDEAVFLADRVIVFTARPGRIKEIINIDLPRPRDRTGPEANIFREQLLTSLGIEIKKAEINKKKG
jgi:NitT/TauT family transport system ATP-binding protein